MYNTRDEVDQLVDVVADAGGELPAYLESDRYHPRIPEHYRVPHNDGMLEDPTFTKHSAETSCGDEGEFHVEVAPGGTIESVGFRSRNCAVSSAVASLLARHLEGTPIEYAASLDAEVDALLGGRFDPIRRDCVRGPEDVIRQGAREYHQARPTPGTGSG